MVNMNVFGDYLLPFLKENDFNLHLRNQENFRNDVAPCVGPQTGRLLAFLIYTLNAKNVLEIGACQGYSTLWMADALQNIGGKLTTLDINEQTFPEAKANIAKAGFNNVTFSYHCTVGEAAISIQTSNDSFNWVNQFQALQAQCVTGGSVSLPVVGNYYRAATSMDNTNPISIIATAHFSK